MARRGLDVFAVVLAVGLTQGVAAAASTSAGSSTAASAGHPCVVLTDPAGDAGLTTEASGKPANDAGLDIVAGVLAGDRKTLRVTVRVSNLASGVQVGRMWAFTLGSSQAPNAYYSVVAIEEADGNGFAIYGPGGTQNMPPLATVTGTLDTVTNSITTAVPLGLLGMHAGEFDTFTAESGRSVGTSGALLSATPAGETPVGQPESTDVISDTASGQRPYIPGRGCSRR